MRHLYEIIYKYLIGQILSLVNFVLSWNNKKIRLREEKWKNLLNSVPKKNSKFRILIHAASLGEFEQVKYLIELLKEKDIEVITSFYSPSGFENTMIGKYSDYKVYMPVDSIKNSKLFAESIDPDVTIFVRYDLWYNHIKALKEINSKILLINATYTSNNFLGKSFIGKKIYESILMDLDSIYAVDDYNAEKFKLVTESNKVNVLPDTRYDRIMSKVKDTYSKSKYKMETENPTLILGSTWKNDEDLSFKVIQKLRSIYTFNLIIVPHEPNDRNLKRIHHFFPNSNFLSEVKNNLLPETTIVDSVGKLLTLYSVADIAYVGGGLGKGVHSVTEAAGYGLPIICGQKNYKNSYDAIELKKNNGLTTINNSNEFYKVIKDYLDNINLIQKHGNLNKDFVQRRTGSSDYLIDKLLSHKS